MSAPQGVSLLQLIKESQWHYIIVVVMDIYFGRQGITSFNFFKAVAL